MPASTITTLSALDANKNNFLEDETYALAFRAEVNGIPLEGVDYVRTDKNGPVAGLGVGMCPLERDNRIKQSDRHQGVKRVEEQTMDILLLSNCQTAVNARQMA